MSSEGQRFRRRALRRGYKVDEVDVFLDRVEATLSGEHTPDPVTAQEVHDIVFRVRFGGYDEWQVDLHLDRVERQLLELEEGGGYRAQRPAEPGRSPLPERLPMGERPPMGERGPMGERPPMGERGPMGERPPMGERGPMGERPPMGERAPAGRMAPDRMMPRDDRMPPVPSMGAAATMGPNVGAPPMGAARTEAPPMGPPPGSMPQRGPAPVGRPPMNPPMGAPPMGPPAPPPGRAAAPPYPSRDQGFGGRYEAGYTSSFNGFEAGRRARADMTSEMRMPEMAPPLAPPAEVQRIDHMRRAFLPRRFGSGYDPAQVDHLFEGIIAALAGRSGVAVRESELDPAQFSLVPGGYFEAEVDAALKEVRDLLRRR